MTRTIRGLWTLHAIFLFKEWCQINTVKRKNVKVKTHPKFFMFSRVFFFFFFLIDKFVTLKHQRWQHLSRVCTLMHHARRQRFETVCPPSMYTWLASATWRQNLYPFCLLSVRASSLPPSPPLLPPSPPSSHLLTNSTLLTRTDLSHSISRLTDRQS